MKWLWPLVYALSGLLKWVLRKKQTPKIQESDNGCDSTDESEDVSV